ncbi:histone H2A.Z-specific chaperone CHZ1-like [Tyto alba]|uniref:histone H2A.Z-specific chaperone CHZ1-like n=1 Tax=Tyto alba TaxID=56313 RepID=UPI001C685445|nr:histone H2A.Z-specific chaperone CHZ1-like [Tyto alba]
MSPVFCETVFQPEHDSRGDNVIEEPPKRGAMLDLVLTNKEGLVGSVKPKGNLETLANGLLLTSKLPSDEHENYHCGDNKQKFEKERNLSGDEDTDGGDDDDDDDDDNDDDDEEGGEETEKEEETEEKYEKEKHSKSPKGEKSSNSTVETVETGGTTQKETIIQQEKEGTDNHSVNNSSENSDDQITGGIFGRKKQKPLTGQKNICSRKEDRSGNLLQSGQEKEKEDLSGEDSKDESQNNTLENSRETVTNQDRRMKSSTCILL